MITVRCVRIAEARQNGEFTVDAEPYLLTLLGSAEDQRWLEEDLVGWVALCESVEEVDTAHDYIDWLARELARWSGADPQAIGNWEVVEIDFNAYRAWVEQHVPESLAEWREDFGVEEPGLDL
jgi:hypothetical protein